MQKSKRKFIIGGVLLLLIAFIIFRVAMTASHNKTAVIDETANVKVTSAAIASIELTSPLTGRIEPVDEVSVIPKAAGQVTNVYVSLGDKVEKGALLFTIDGTQMQSSLAQANAGYAQATAGYEQAVTSYNNAKENFDRIAVLYQEGAVSKQQYDQAKYQLDSANNALRQSQASINQAKAGVSMASDGARNTRVTAPIGGYITAVYVAEGGMASQAGAAVSIANIDTVEINCAVTETLINKIKVGDNVDVMVKSVSDKAFIGTITALSPAPAVGSLTYPIKVSISNPDVQIKPGMFAEVVVASEKLTDILTVPSDCVIIKGGKSVVAVITGNKVQFKEVVTGLDNGQLVEIKSGVTVNDTIVTEGQYYLQEGDTVNIIES